MTVEMFVALLVFLFPLAYSPGPGNAFFAAIGASRGVRATLPALAGYHVATFVITAAIGLGLGVAVLRDPVVSTVLAAAGSLYVLWLAFGFFRSARASHGDRSATDPPAPTSIGFWTGALVLVLNPKAYSIIAVMFVQFLVSPAEDGVTSVLAITTVFTINNLIAFVAWAVAGRALSALFRTERSRRWIDYAFAATLLGVAVWMALPIFL